MAPVRRALLSVADKAGLTAFAAGLARLGIDLLATGGTAQELRDAGIDHTDVAQVTGMGVALGGRVKTLHPALLGGILADRDVPGCAAELEALGGKPIDLVAVNFYPFAQGHAAGKTLDELIELIDIGGPTMVRAAAKNHRHVAVVTDPADYGQVVEDLATHAGAVPRQRTRELAGKAFALTAGYDAGVTAAFAASAPPLPVAGKWQELAYGENPHQRGWVAEPLPIQLGGPRLSYNNLQDAVAAWRCVADQDATCCAIIKHANPCGVAVAADGPMAHARALAADPAAAYGGVVAFNRPVDEATLAAVRDVFCEVLVAPGYSAGAAARLAAAKRIRALHGPLGMGDLDVRMHGGLVLAQDRDTSPEDPAGFVPVTAQAPTAAQRADLLFAWRVAQHARSNAIVLVRDGATLGIGAGQPSRVGAAELAVRRARDAGFDCTGAVAASDAFFPFPDGVERLLEAGVAALIQPGGSRRDTDAIAAADAAGAAMLTTGTRHFSH